MRPMSTLPAGNSVIVTDAAAALADRPIRASTELSPANKPAPSAGGAQEASGDQPGKKAVSFQAEAAAEEDLDALD